MLQSLQKIQKKQKDKEDLQDMYDNLKDLKQTFLLALLYQEIQDISKLKLTDEELQEATKESDNEEFLSGQETAKFLQDHTDVHQRRSPHDPGQIEYLLSRPTESYEYQKGSSQKKSFNLYHNTQQTEWFIQTQPAWSNQFDENPVITCWVPEKAIAGTTTPHQNTGTLGELGKNPFEEHIVVLVKPGQYEIYSELKENSGHTQQPQSLDQKQKETVSEGQNDK